MAKAAINYFNSDHCKILFYPQMATTILKKIINYKNEVGIQAIKVLKQEMNDNTWLCEKIPNLELTKYLIKMPK